MKIHSHLSLHRATAAGKWLIEGLLLTINWSPPVRLPWGPTTFYSSRPKRDTLHVRTHTHWWFNTVTRRGLPMWLEKICFVSLIWLQDTNFLIVFNTCWAHTLTHTHACLHSDALSYTHTCQPTHQPLLDRRLKGLAVNHHGCWHQRTRCSTQGRSFKRSEPCTQPARERESGSEGGARCQRGERCIDKVGTC